MKDQAIGLNCRTQIANFAVARCVVRRIKRFRRDDAHQRNRTGEEKQQAREFSFFHVRTNQLTEVGTVKLEAGDFGRNPRAVSVKKKGRSVRLRAAASCHLVNTQSLTAHAAIGTVIHAVH